ncbi:MAG: GNAT family N-acetyltransferase [Acutalibacteraceae bacterium]|nr:GNAT family N-acetyltransferase [Acutalibacteraceae bacterium]
MIRSATLEEAEKVNEIREQVLQVQVNGRRDIFKSCFNNDLKNYIYKFYENENADVLICERDRIICGFACVEFVNKPESPYSYSRKYFHIEEFGVHKNCRRQGVGTELFEYIKQLANKNGYTRLELDMWEFNTGALKFYESVGFKTYRRYMEIEK